MTFKVIGTGSYVPPLMVTNEDLCKYVDTSDEWIVQRVGVRERHLCTTETAADLAFEAAKKALENGNTRVEELDMIICATVSGEDISPSVSCHVQQRLGATCPALDINAACSAFIYMLETAAGYFARKKVKRVLVIGAERMSRIMDWNDRSTCVIFGDGAGAVLLAEGDGYIASKLYTKGGDEVIKIPNFIGCSPFFKKEQLKPYIHMKGQETFKFAVNAMCTDIKDVISEAGIYFDEVDHVIPHQANIRIIEAAQKRLPIKPERFHTNIEKYGNTSAASIPLLMDELNREGLIKKDDILVLAAFGGGLSSGACILRW